MLQFILKKKEEELFSRMAIIPLEAVRERAQRQTAPRDFTSALKQRPRIGAPSTKIIAEIKKASPSRGIIKQDFDPASIAKIYEQNGACAISVVTEEKFFHGKLDHLIEVKGACPLPLLRKDFIFSDYQVYESRAWGADALLLIAAALEPHRLKALCRLAAELAMQPLVEVHNEGELASLPFDDLEIIGINNRDLSTFKTQIETTLRLLKLIPEGKIVVSESGINSRLDIELLEKNGVKAFLIGSALMESDDPGAKLGSLLGRCPE